MKRKAAPNATSILLAMADWRSLAVLRRNMLVYLRNWRTVFLPPAMEPVVFFLAFGLGLGSYVGQLQVGGRPVEYATYVAPGLLAYTAFSTPFFEGLYSSYVRMFYQKTWDGILATQIELHHIAWGEVLWAGCRGMLNTAVVALVLGLFHAAGLIHIHWPFLLITPFIACVAGWAFGALALVFTAIVPSIDHMNYPVFLLAVPLGLVSNTYFPVPTHNRFVALLVELNPVYHLAETFRGLLVNGAPDRHLAGLLTTVLVLLATATLLSQRLLRRRVLGE